MKVVYLPSDNDQSWDGETLFPTSITGSTRYLTPGKIYDVIEEFPCWNSIVGTVNDFKYTHEPFSDSHSYKIIDDLGHSRWYDSKVLIPLDRLREDKLNQLGI